MNALLLLWEPRSDEQAISRRAARRGQDQPAGRAAGGLAQSERPARPRAGAGPATGAGRHLPRGAIADQQPSPPARRTRHHHDLRPGATTRQPVLPIDRRDRRLPEPRPGTRAAQRRSGAIFPRSHRPAPAGRLRRPEAVPAPPAGPDHRQHEQSRRMRLPARRDRATSRGSLVGGRTPPGELSARAGRRPRLPPVLPGALAARLLPAHRHVRPPFAQGQVLPGLRRGALSPRDRRQRRRESADHARFPARRVEHVRLGAAGRG